MFVNILAIIVVGATLLYRFGKPYDSEHGTPRNGL